MCRICDAVALLHGGNFQLHLIPATLFAVRGLDDNYAASKKNLPLNSDKYVNLDLEALETRCKTFVSAGRTVGADGAIPAAAASRVATCDTSVTPNTSGVPVYFSNSDRYPLPSQPNFPISRRRSPSQSRWNFAIGIPPPRYKSPTTNTRDSPASNQSGPISTARSAPPWNSQHSHLTTNPTSRRTPIGMPVSGSVLSSS